MVVDVIGPELAIHHVVPGLFLHGFSLGQAVQNVKPAAMLGAILYSA
jgi:hypothetical protein